MVIYMLISKTLKFSYVIDKHLDIDTILSYCLDCFNYGKNYSCPPFNQHPIELYKNNKYLKVYIFTYANSDNLNIDNLYSIVRKKLDLAIFDYESKTFSTALIPGRCLLCDPCKKIYNEKCLFPDKIRHSLETLGFQISTLLLDELNYELKWNNNDLTLVFGFLSDYEIQTDFEDVLSKYL